MAVESDAIDWSCRPAQSAEEIRRDGGRVSRALVRTSDSFVNLLNAPTKATETFSFENSFLRLNVDIRRNLLQNSFKFSFKFKTFLNKRMSYF